ncbi:alpha/beta-hydrolase [Mycena crocata]|nr:alpha/beta-hydrolase [Mycena crocata]
MDHNLYKQAKTQRGFNYSYYFSPAAAGKPVLFFSHGFPTSSYFWRKQVAFFKPLGYGILAPDQLGYAGTDKPTDPKLYIGSGLAQDIVDVLDGEGIEQVIAVGHDWGSRVVSRMLNYHPHRISACAFFGLGYLPPQPQHGADPITRSPQIKQMLGHDVLAYQRFFIQPDAASVIEAHLDSFLNLVYPEKPEVWIEHLAVDGGARAWIESNTTTALPSYMTQEDKEYHHKTLASGGLSAPLCWYKVQVEKANADDDANVPSTAYDIAQSLFFVAFTAEFPGLPSLGDMSHGKHAKGPVTRKEVAGDHWAVESHAGELNQWLLEWIEAL